MYGPNLSTIATLTLSKSVTIILSLGLLTVLVVIILLNNADNSAQTAVF